MRARYVAYRQGLAEFIITTTDPSGPQWETDHANWIDDITTFSETTIFDGLTILETSVDEERRGTVSFCAWLRQDGSDASFGECSRFVRDAHRWLYVDGSPLDPTTMKSARMTRGAHPS